MLGNAPEDDRAARAAMPGHDEPVMLLEDEPTGEQSSSTARIGAEPLAVASLLMGLASLLGMGTFVVSLVLQVGYDGSGSLKSATIATSGTWAPGLVAIVLALLARRASGTGTPAWSRHLWLGTLIAVCCMIALVVLAVLYGQTTPPDPAFS